MLGGCGEEGGGVDGCCCSLLNWILIGSQCEGKSQDLKLVFLFSAIHYHWHPAVSVSLLKAKKETHPPKN